MDCSRVSQWSRRTSLFHTVKSCISTILTRQRYSWYSENRPTYSHLSSSEGRGLFGAVPHSADDPGKLSR